MPLKDSCFYKVFPGPFSISCPMNLRGRHSLTSIISIVPAKQCFLRIFEMLLFQNGDAALTQTICFGLAGLSVVPMLPRDRSLTMEGPYSVSPFLGNCDSSCSRN